MKTIFCLLLSIFLVGCNPTINVYNENLNQINVNKALLIWGVEWRSVKSFSEADLVIKQVYPQQMHCSANVGEFHFGHDLILLNNRFCKQASNKDITNLIAHEIGHYFYIEHTNVPNALMNHRSHLNTRRITHYEVDSFKKNRCKFLIYLYFRRLIKNFTELS